MKKLMSKQEIIDPNVGNFIESLREIGYSFEVAVADLIDNCITANASSIKIYTVAKPSLIFSILDNGGGMTEKQVVEAMRLASRNPKETRGKSDLGRFGLGLKTASFSQCRKLTVISKRAGKISYRQWDLDYISKKNKWYLLIPEHTEQLPLYSDLMSQKSGTLVCWENIDRIDKNAFASSIETLRKHLSLVFHRYLEGADRFKLLSISVNEHALSPFNPFNSGHPATQQITAEKIKIYNSSYSVQPFILPHHSKLSQQEYDLYATEDGYIKSQGFYLYRENRILIYGTWWGLHKYLDAHKLVRIKIDIPNSMDFEWGIDIKKSIARPSEEVRKNLKRIIGQITEKGSRPYSGRGRKIENKQAGQFWEIVAHSDDFHFTVNVEHPMFLELKKDLKKETFNKFILYLKALQAFLPIDAIQYRMQKNPLQLKQKNVLSEAEKSEISQKLIASGLSEQYINELLEIETAKKGK